MLQLLLVIFGLVALVKGGFNITRNRRVSGSISKILGGAMLLAAILPVLLPVGSGVLWLTLIGVIIVGLITSTKVEDEAVETAEVEGN